MAGDVLVAGGTGALGSAVLRELLEAGFGVTATWVVEAERERAERELGQPDRLAFVEADLMTEEGAESAGGARSDLAPVGNLVGGFTSRPLPPATALPE